MQSTWLHHGRRLAGHAFVLFLLVAPTGTDATSAAVAEAAEATMMERRVKAAFLYKFAGYVQWPAESFPRSTTPIVIGVAGDKRMAAELSQLVVGRTSAGRRILVVQPERDERVKDLHILFVGRFEEPRLERWIDAVHDAPTLVVTDFENALDRGSMINFILSEGHVRFEISTAPAEKCGLSLNSGLLAVAKSVVAPKP